MGYSLKEEIHNESNLIEFYPGRLVRIISSEPRLRVMKREKAEIIAFNPQCQLNNTTLKTHSLSARALWRNSIRSFELMTGDLRLTTEMPGGSGAITVKGTVSDTHLDKVTVNGVDATITGNTYEAGIELNEGPNTITVIARDKAGNETLKSIQVTLVSAKAINFQYDNNGNLTRKDEDGAVTTYQYDEENKLISAVTLNGSVDFKYDELGRRIQKTGVGGQKTDFVYDGNEIIQDNESRVYIHGRSIDERIAFVEEGSSSYYLIDALGVCRRNIDFV